MKIGQFEPKIPQPATPAAERKGTLATDAGAVEPSAKVALSASVALRTGGTGDESFDAAKVERISAAIKDGSFKADAGAIADKLIANAQEVLGRSQS
jgi:negative regulator of flagellin synthesis FlgM